MAKVICPDCSEEIPGDDVNVEEGVAYCRACGSLTRLADILEDAEDTDEHGPVDVTEPPRGCRIEDEGNVIRVIASARSVGTALGALLAGGFWNGIVSIFVLVAISGTLNLIFGSVPTWFPAPNMNGQTMGLGMVLFFWIFLTPFILIGAGMAFAFVNALFGRCEVRLRGRDGTIFTGVGPIGWRRRFDASAVTSVRGGKTTWSQNDERQRCIVIHAAKKHRLASCLTGKRRAWMTTVLRRLIILE
jgi:hypothetical protein